MKCKKRKMGEEVSYLEALQVKVRSGNEKGKRRNE